MTEPAIRKKLSYIPSLDGARGVFCILIIVNHWQLALPISPIGWEVLQIFFVISGFLITRILISKRDQHNTFKGFVRDFYIRRSLRIFPLYFIYLLGILLLRFLLSGSEFITTFTQELANDWAYYFTYTSNIKALFNYHSLETPFFMHLWSLGLEEQFYLLMPFFVFYLNTKWFKRVLVAIILLPIITRPLGYMWLTSMNDDPIWAGVFVFRNLPFQCDAFALGAAVAVFPLNWIKRPKLWFYSLLAIYIAILVRNYSLFIDFAPYLLNHFNATIDSESIGIFGYLNSLGHPELLPMQHSYNYMMPLVNLMSFFMVLASVRGEPLFSKLFLNKTMIKVGKVTYGMYVFHFALIVVFVKAVTTIMGTGPQQIHPLLHIPLFAIYLLMLYYLSKFSFIYLEGPFLKLKSKFK